MAGHSLRIAHGYGGETLVKLDDLCLENVKSFILKGERNKLPELTVTLDVASAVCGEVAETPSIERNYIDEGTQETSATRSTNTILGRGV